MRKMIIVFVLGISLVLVGCAGMTDTQQRALTGGAMGAAGGAAIGALAGNAALGAAIGGAAGASGGFLYGRHRESNQRAFNQGVEAGRQGR